jgi:hypothetical protein
LLEARGSRADLQFYIGVFRNLGAALGRDLQIGHFASPLGLRLKEALEGQEPMPDSLRVELG